MKGGTVQVFGGKNLTNPNLVHEEIKSRLRSRNACYHAVQGLLSSGFLFKYIMIEINITVIFPVVLYGCETWPLTLKEERGLRLIENRVLYRTSILRFVRDQILFRINFL